jgi:hypothetical protein
MPTKSAAKAMSTTQCSRCDGHPSLVGWAKTWKIIEGKWVCPPCVAEGASDLAAERAAERAADTKARMAMIQADILQIADDVRRQRETRPPALDPIETRNVANHLEDEYPEILDIKLERCSFIEDERAAGKAGSKRYYAHVDHRKNVICFASDVGKLDPTKQAAILLHEVGHLLDDWGEVAASKHELEKAEKHYEPGRVDEEAAANQAVMDAFGIEITYGRDGVQKITQEDLEWLELQ